MERDFTYALKTLDNLRNANLSPASIETVIRGLKISQSEKSAMSILNRGQSEQPIQYILSKDLRDYSPSEPGKTDYPGDVYKHFLICYEIGPNRFNYN